ncbi:MAG: glutaredoxin [Rhodospirillaceae bacterium]|nr:glutaredoxin [Rhodospirillaceae bacterium]MBL6932739.1 glutaredoxin [Rhodospirillales bacterium]
MKFIRWFLGRIILAVDFLTRPKPVVREPRAQDAVDAMSAKMSLYQFNACPFCVKVRRQLRKHALNIELRDAKNNLQFKQELTNEGGKHKVPCLRIEESTNSIKWIYNSKDICSFLEKQFSL